MSLRLFPQLTLALRSDLTKVDYNALPYYSARPAAA